MLGLSEIGLRRRSGRVETRLTFVIAAGIIGLMVIVCRALCFGGDIIFHADDTVGMVVMRNNRYHQHKDVDEK